MPFLLHYTYSLKKTDRIYLQINKFNLPVILKGSTICADGALVVFGVVAIKDELR